MNKSARLIFGIVMLCFFVSGMAGLVYQVAWARYLALFMGHTSYAVIAVLVAFMGGLAVGNAWFGVRADKTRKPLAIYAWLEILIAVYAIAFPFYYAFCHDLFVGLARQLQPGSTGLLILKFGFSFLTILAPTIMMGATFPILTKFVTRALAELRERVAALYFINSAGAVAGTLLAGFWLVPIIGIEMTVYAGAALNLVAGLLALVVSMWMKEGEKGLQDYKPVIEKSEEVFRESELRLAVVAIGLSGFVAMLYEVAWTRLLALSLGSSTHAFTLMLVTFISGIAVGAYVIYQWKSLKRTLDAFAWAELALAASLLVSMFFYHYLPYWFVKLAAMLARDEVSYPIYQLLQALISFGVMFIPAMFLGMTLPLASRIATAELARTGRSVGKVFAVNTVGTVLGAVVTGLWLLPTLGLARTFALGIAINAIIGLVLLTWNRVPMKWMFVSPVAAVILILFAGARFDPIWQSTFTLGLWRAAVAPETRHDFMELARGKNIIYYKDGAGSTVTVEEHELRGRRFISMRVNGKTDASTGSDVTTQRLSGHIPMFLRPQSTNALVIGIGSGMTGAALMRHPTMQQVDMVEISPEVVAGAHFFADFNDEVMTNPQVRILVEDAKSFLKITDTQYDIIISEPSNPWMAGVSGVFSREYYESCLSRLREDGLMAQWVQVYETNNETLNMVLRTFGTVFPYISLWQTAVGDLILIGSRQPLPDNLAAMEERFEYPAVREDLARTDILTLPVLLARQLVSEYNGVFIPPAEGPIHSDYFPELEYAAQRAFFVRDVATRWREVDESLWSRPINLLGLYMQQRELTEADFEALGLFFLEHRLPTSYLFRTILHRWQMEFPQSTLPLEFSAQMRDERMGAELEAFRFAPMREHLYQLAEEDSEPLRLYASMLMQTHRNQRSAYYLPPSGPLEKILQRLIGTDPKNQRVYRLHLAELAWDRGEEELCFDLAYEAFHPEPERGGPVTFGTDPSAPRWVLLYMIETLWRAGRMEQAWELCLEVERGQYLDREEAYPLLEMVIRKVSASMAALHPDEFPSGLTGVVK